MEKVRLKLDAELGLDFQKKYKGVCALHRTVMVDQREHGQAGGATRSPPGTGVTLSSM